MTGIRNVIAIEGSKIPKSVAELTKRKTTTAFLDGDRGGDLDLKKLLVVGDIDFVARAEEGKEVEELTQKEIYKALREKMPINQINGDEIRGGVRTDKRTYNRRSHGKLIEKKEVKLDSQTSRFFKTKLNELVGTRAAFFVDKNMKIISKIPITEIGNVLNDFRNVYAVIFDGKINQTIVDIVLQRKVQYLVGNELKEDVNSSILNVLTIKDLN